MLLWATATLQGQQHRSFKSFQLLVEEGGTGIVLAAAGRSAAMPSSAQRCSAEVQAVRCMSGLRVQVAVPRSTAGV
jgi:hypothetical protein